MRAPLLPLLFALALLPAAGAEECVPSSATSNEDMTVIELPTCDALVCYVVVDHDTDGDGCTWGIWVYPEANGHPGLQRNDECHDSTCGGMVESDTTII